MAINDMNPESQTKNFRGSLLFGLAFLVIAYVKGMAQNAVLHTLLTFGNAQTSLALHSACKILQQKQNDWAVHQKTWLWG